MHGTNSPKTVGYLVASGCIRLVNDDVEELYRRVSLEARVVFVS
ncbi:L,D-transpeptidase [Afipia sp. DC4300-2b1]